MCYPLAEAREAIWLRCGGAMSTAANPNSISSNLHPLRSCFIYLFKPRNYNKEKLMLSVATAKQTARYMLPD
jgi:hypothetical protein